MRYIRHYIRVFFRSNFRPIPVETAKKGELITSLIYFTLAWTVLGMTLCYLKKNYKPSNYNSYESHGFTAFTHGKKCARVWSAGQPTQNYGELSRTNREQEQSEERNSVMDNNNQAFPYDKAAVYYQESSKLDFTGYNIPILKKAKNIIHGC
ncbi:uncharacterized protein TNIN_339731 [Trichonephila inaurata madagascariensis]|uniref:Uncharacterized protein n=1 Tax=Trichonephila inaurata madagascariensis TaxID=2747483 RepID=A0A8X6YIP5_9ARAC|nr:uncharacterized protein TNIN_339731 [Trichonephila inaurata madagascariensis]